jgi:hypothetical protein
MSQYRSERGNIGKLLISKTILILLSANVIVMTPVQFVNTANAQEQTRFVPLFLAPIAASGDNVYVTWWDNKTGTREVYFRASTDNGETFGNTIMLNVTSGGGS